MHAPPKHDDPIATVDDLATADGIVLGFPTRFGGAPAQVRALLDATGGLWQAGTLVGKPVSMLTSTASIGGGAEATILTTLPFLAHHGMLFVPAGYRAGVALFSVDGARGGSPWGASTLAGGAGSRHPLELEKAMAEDQVRARGLGASSPSTQACARGRGVGNERNSATDKPASPSLTPPPPHPHPTPRAKCSPPSPRS